MNYYVNAVVIGGALGIVLTLFGSPACTPPATPTFDAGDSSDADVLAKKAATCTDYCANATKLNCEESKPTPAGASCIDVCNNFTAQGIAHWNMTCRATATSCQAIDACN